MPITQFDDPVVRADGQLVVGGPFILSADERARLLGDVVIRFLVIQDSDRNRENGAGNAMAEGTASWKQNEPDRWQHIVPAARAQGFVVGARVRGIGCALLVKEAPAPSPDEPPSFESVTWCVSKHVAQG